jgi:hypothetical protein
MKLAFTICSINYLSQAITLGDTLMQHNPDYNFIIGLVDVTDNRLPYHLRPHFPLLEVADLRIPDFTSMCSRYNITELNTAVKPFYFEYFFKEYPNLETAIYFDPDIMIFNPLTKLEADLKNNDAVFTPHILSPYHDDLAPRESDFTNTGIFNLGFGAFRKTDATINFLKWWQEKLKTQCIVALPEGLFVDQLWAMYAIVYLDHFAVEKNAGYNMANWNLHERKLGKENGNWLVNDQPLIFYHFSSIKLKEYKGEDFIPGQTRYRFSDRPDVTEIVQLYQSFLKANHDEEYKKINCAYVIPPSQGDLFIKSISLSLIRMMKKYLPVSWKNKIKKMVY